MRHFQRLNKIYKCAMSSKKTKFGVYTDVRTERYQDTTLKNAKDSKISKRVACKSEIMAWKTVCGTLIFHHFHYYINKATSYINKCCIQSKSVMPSLAKQNSCFKSTFEIR